MNRDEIIGVRKLKRFNPRDFYVWWVTTVVAE